jgi:hypothetical protein
MEVVITTAIVSVLALGGSSLILDMFAAEKKSATLKMLAQLRVGLIQAITTATVDPVANPTAWDRTVADLTDPTGNPSMACLQNHTACTKDTPQALNLKYQDGTEAFYARIATRGFRWDGSICNTFSLATPDSSCPFRYNLTWVARCVDKTVGSVKTACLNPMIEVNADLLFAPGASDPLNGQPINFKVYEIRARRGDGGQTNLPVIIANIVDEATAGIVGEGRCDIGGVSGGVARRFNTIVSDPGSNVSFPSATSFTLKRGSYECRLQSPGFKNGGNKIRLVGGSYDLSSSMATAALTGGAVNLTMQANLILSSDTTFQVIHSCTSHPQANTFGAQTDSWAMGVPVPAPGADYTAVTYSTVTCVKTS